MATLLETLRALKAGPPLQQDVIFLITDGEEMGLLGAQAWVSEHPWAKDAGLFLNFEMRGAGGPAFLFEVNEGNGALMRELARAVPDPWSTSLAADVYRRMPNDTCRCGAAAVAVATRLAECGLAGAAGFHVRDSGGFAVERQKRP